MCMAHRKHSNFLLLLHEHEWINLSPFAFNFFLLCFLAIELQHHGFVLCCCHLVREDRIGKGKWNWGSWQKRRKSSPYSSSHVYQGSQGQASDKPYLNLEWGLVTTLSVNLAPSKEGSATGAEQQNQMEKKSFKRAFSSFGSFSLSGH